VSSSASDTPAVVPALLVSDCPRDDATEFSFDRITQTLSQFIAVAPAGAPFNVCLSGTWGSGKTTLLRSLATALDPVRDKEGAPYVAVWFEPWKLADERQVRDALTLLVLNRIGADAKFMTQAKIDVDGGSLVRILGERFLKVKLDDVSRVARSETAVRGTFVEVEQLFHAITTKYLRDRRMIVFVDDLDRCNPSVMLAVLEAVKLFFDLPGLVFVFALDRDQLERAIAEAYQFTLAEAHVYLEKIFQLSVPLPRKRPEDLVAFLRTNLREVGLEVADTQLAEAVVSRFGRNLRDLKLFVNALSFQRRLVDDGDSKGIGEEAVLKWLYLEATMSSSLEAALADRSLDLVLALELLAYGGFLHDGNVRDRYVGRLRHNALNYCALIVYAIVGLRAPEEFDEVELTVSQQAIVGALNADGGLDATLRVLRAGSTRLLDVDLWQLAALTRERPPEGSEPRTRDDDKDGELALHVEGVLKAEEWRVRCATPTCASWSPR
jgi:energy-coupling factor transporter ATP-binding protein EcfA2